VFIMKKKILSVLLAGVIALASVPTVVAEEPSYVLTQDCGHIIMGYSDRQESHYVDGRVVTEYNDGRRTVASEDFNSTQNADRSLQVFENRIDGVIGVLMCDVCLTDELLAELVENGTIPQETTMIDLSLNFCRTCTPEEFRFGRNETEKYAYFAALPRQLTDLSPLSRLTELVEIHTNAPIVDLSPLAELTNLTNLSLSRLRVSDLSPLAGLTNLRYLLMSGDFIHADGMPLSDLSPLSGLTNLERLYVSNSNVADLSPIAGLTKIESLSFYGSNVSDVSPLAGLTNLWHLNLRYNPVTDISPLADLDVHIMWDGNPANPATAQMLGRLAGLGQATVQDALAILRYTVGLSSILDICSDAYAAALIVSEDTPGVRDALQILRSVVGLSSVLD
jgi:hypothetical protein